MSPRRASQPPPLPPLRARPFTSLLFAPGRARPDARCPPPLPVGAKIPKQNRLRHPQPLPRPFPRFAPVRSRPSASLRDVPGRTARCPLPLPAGAFKHINSYLSTQLLCVRPLPPCKRFFFPLLGHSPGPMPRYASAWAQASALAKVFRLRTP